MAAVLAGVDIGGTKISVVIADESGHVLGRGRRKSKPERGFAGVMARVQETVDEACMNAGVLRSALSAVGVGAPSPILPDGTAVSAVNMGWTNVPLTEALSELLGIPTFAENDCNVGTFGEYTLAGRKGTLVGLFMGTGLGGGVVKDGVILSGDHFLAGEIGHMTIVPDGRPCGCGKLGCLEAYASKTGLAYEFKQAIWLEKKASILPDLVDEGGLDNVKSSLLRRAWDERDDVTRAALKRAARYIGIAAGNLITLLGPSAVVLGGGVMDALGDELLPLVKKSAEEHAFPAASYRATAIELASLGDDAVALGAMAYARSRLA
jgi:glucokinase